MLLKSEKWLFSNHVDIEVLTTLLLQSVVIIFQCNLCTICITMLWNCSMFRPCRKLTKQESSKRMLLHATSICHRASNPESLGCKLSVSRMPLWLWLKLYWISWQLSGCCLWPNSGSNRRNSTKKLKKNPKTKTHHCHNNKTQTKNLQTTSRSRDLIITK